MIGLLVFAAFAQEEACPDGMVRSEYTQGVCCWPGQAHNGTTCVGIPRCPDGMRTLPDRCEKAAPRAPKPPPPPPTRNVLFAGDGLSGQRLFIDEVEVGELPNAFALTLGVHRWEVRNALDAVLAAGELKVREGDGDQIHMLRRPKRDED